MNLTKTQIDALAELGRFEQRSNNNPFWWRKASMAVLAQHGYVVAWSPYGKARKIMAYRLNDAGRAALAERREG
jgi:DNA-binding PadR family transcriptional regulator